MGIRKTTWHHIRRSPFHAFAAIVTIFITFLLGGVFLLLTTASVEILAYFESKPQITVFFSDSATMETVDKMKKTLLDTGMTSSLVYVSKDQALALYKSQYKDDPLLLEMVTADILPASLEVTAKEPSFLKELEPIIKKSEGIEDIAYQKDVVDALVIWTRAIRITGIILAGMLMLDSLLIIMTVIGLNIAIRKDEIEILKLVGASPSYIRIPFLLEGVFYGFSGSVLAAVVVLGTVYATLPYIGTFLGAIPSISSLLTQPFSQTSILYAGVFAGILLSSGSILGLIGSAVSIGRYLKF